MIKDLWVTNSNALIDRPWQPGFINHLGIDISSSPMIPTIRKCRAAAMKALGRPMWPSYYHLLEPNSVKMCQQIYTRGQDGKLPTDLYPYFRQVVTDLCLSLTYGARMGDINDEFSLELLHALQSITEVRSSTEDFSHYVPLLRVIPKSTSKTIAAEKVRRRLLDILYDQYLEKVAKGETVNCIVSELGKEKLTLDELRGTCNSLLQAAPDTVASGIYQAAGWLSSHEGRTFQPEAYKAILEAYDGNRDQAWDMAFREEKVPLIASLYKEALRCYSPTPFAQGRATVREINYNGIRIPKGITMIMNAQDANIDPRYFGHDAAIFNPARFIGNDSSLPTLAFGAGSRQCPATNIASRIMYAMLTRLILAFEIKEAKGPGMRQPSLDKRDFSDVHGLVDVPRPFDCYLVARDPVWLQSLSTTRGKKA
jgi:phenylacetate 2-hydroxylase